MFTIVPDITETKPLNLLIPPALPSSLRYFNFIFVCRLIFYLHLNKEKEFHEMKKKWKLEKHKKDSYYESSYKKGQLRIIDSASLFLLHSWITQKAFSRDFSWLIMKKGFAFSTLPDIHLLLSFCSLLLYYFFSHFLNQFIRLHSKVKFH